MINAFGDGKFQDGITSLNTMRLKSSKSEPALAHLMERKTGEANGTVKGNAAASTYRQRKFKVEGRDGVKRQRKISIGFGMDADADAEEGADKKIGAPVGDGLF